MKRLKKQPGFVGSNRSVWQVRQLQQLQQLSGVHGWQKSTFPACLYLASNCSPPTTIRYHSSTLK
jgi:hypothetical protein